MGKCFRGDTPFFKFSRSSRLVVDLTHTKYFYVSNFHWKIFYVQCTFEICVLLVCLHKKCAYGIELLVNGRICTFFFALTCNFLAPQTIRLSIFGINTKSRVIFYHFIALHASGRDLDSKYSSIYGVRKRWVSPVARGNQILPWATY